MTPEQLLFPDYAGSNLIYRFGLDSGGNPHFTRESGTGYNSYSVLVSLEKKDTDGAYYIISVVGFKKNELPTVKDFRLTFKPTVFKVSIDSVESYLIGNSIPTARLTKAGCDVGLVKSHICLDTITKVRVIGKTLESHLRQTIPLKGIRVGGNAAAPGGTLANFIQSGNALAVGHSVSSIEGGQTIEGYDVSSSPIKWTNIGQKLTEQFNAQKSINKIEADIYNANSWNLNSIDNGTPANLASDSFSTPPEGKLWNIYVDPTDPDSNGSYHFGPGDNGEIRLSGSGTITVRGIGGQQMPIIVHGKISCAPGTRFALVTEGDITFNTPPNNGKISIECGSFTSLNGNITFGNGNVLGGDVRGIFVAKKNIVLPEPSHLESVFGIDPDTVITTNPTVLLRELLKIVFGSSS